MNRTGWEHYELEKVIINSNMAQLLELFKRESEKYINKCVEYSNSLSKLTEDSKKQVEEECQLLNEGRVKIAVYIAEKLTDFKSIQLDFA
jgi:hypothetical protein